MVMVAAGIKSAMDNYKRMGKLKAKMDRSNAIVKKCIAIPIYLGGGTVSHLLSCAWESGRVRALFR